jgi:uncharacterized protein YecE (DUF72 family)
MSGQLDLFGNADPAPAPSHGAPVAAPEGAAMAGLAARLPASLYLGTSSWSFPGWRGIVYAGAHDASLLSRQGLSAYAAHPLLRTVSIDRTYYAPIGRAEFEAHARQVPRGFRFMVKAPADCTTPWLRGADGRPSGDNPRFLDTDFALGQFVMPALEGLAAACGVLLFQFPPQGRATLRDPSRFAARLSEFLDALPRGPLYAVELRDAPLLTGANAEALRSHGVRHCLGVHPKAGVLADQLDVIEATGPGALVVRWNLNPAHTYEAAKERYAPFDRLQEEDPPTRATLAAACAAALNAGQEVHVVANNKAEGSAPLTLVKLADEIARRL